MSPQQMQQIQFIYGHAENTKIMKTTPDTPVYTNLLTDDKKTEIKANIAAHWDDFYTADELAVFIENGYIFGMFAHDEHFLYSDIMELIAEVNLEKNTPFVPQPILNLDGTPVLDADGNPTYTTEPVTPTE